MINISQKTWKIKTMPKRKKQKTEKSKKKKKVKMKSSAKVQEKKIFYPVKKKTRDKKSQETTFRKKNI